MSISDHVEIPLDYPQDASWRSDRSKFIKEVTSGFWGRRSVDIGNEEGKVSGGGGEVNRERWVEEEEPRRVKTESDQAVRTPPEAPSEGE